MGALPSTTLLSSLSFAMLYRYSSGIVSLILHMESFPRLSTFHIEASPSMNNTSNSEQFYGITSSSVLFTPFLPCIFSFSLVNTLQYNDLQ